jgi:hypothetical protein
MTAIADRRRKRFKNAALVLCGRGSCRDLVEQMVIYQVPVQPRGCGRLVPRLNKIAEGDADGLGNPISHRRRAEPTL